MVCALPKTLGKDRFQLSLTFTKDVVKYPSAPYITDTSHQPPAFPAHNLIAEKIEFKKVRKYVKESKKRHHMRGRLMFWWQQRTSRRCNAHEKDAHTATGALHPQLQTFIFLWKCWKNLLI